MLVPFVVNATWLDIILLNITPLKKLKMENNPKKMLNA